MDIRDSKTQCHCINCTSYLLSLNSILKKESKSSLNFTRKLRKFSLQGFINQNLRTQIQPSLLNFNENKLLKQNKISNSVKPFSSQIKQIEKDCKRSVLLTEQIFKREGVSELCKIKDKDRKSKVLNEITKRQKRLCKLIDRIFIDNANISYYQGFHDICSVFYIVLGENLSFRVLQKLSKLYLRDFLRSNLDAVIEILSLIFSLLQHLDSQLYKFLIDVQMKPYFALSQILTQFSHNIKNFEVTCRLFDFFLASHPLMPVYFSVVVILNSKNELIEYERDFSAVHCFLQSLPSKISLGKIDSLIKQCMQIYDDIPPFDLLLRSTTLNSDLKKALDVCKSNITKLPDNSPIQAINIDQILKTANGENFFEELNYKDKFFCLEMRRRERKQQSQQRYLVSIFFSSYKFFEWIYCILPILLTFFRISLLTISILFLIVLIPIFTYQTQFNYYENAVTKFYPFFLNNTYSKISDYYNFSNPALNQIKFYQLKL